MTDPNPPLSSAVLTPEVLPLAEWYPACFDWENPRPLQLNIHKQLIRAGRDRETVLRALAAYCTAPRYRKTLRAGAPRIDLQGQSAGVVTEKEAAHARLLLTPRAERAAAARSALPSPNIPLPQEHLVPGRLELTVKFSELPQPLAVQGGMKIGIATGEGLVTALLPPKVWRKLEQATQDYPQWVAALSGALDHIKDGEIALKHPALQVFEKKTKPVGEASASAETSSVPASTLPPPATQAPTVPSPNPHILHATLTLKDKSKKTG